MSYVINRTSLLSLPATPWLALNVSRIVARIVARVVATEKCPEDTKVAGNGSEMVEDGGRKKEHVTIHMIDGINYMSCDV